MCVIWFTKIWWCRCEVYFSIQSRVWLQADPARAFPSSTTAEKNVSSQCIAVPCSGGVYAWGSNGASGQMYLSPRHKMRLHELHANFYSVAVPRYLTQGIIIINSIIIINFQAEIETLPWFPPCRLCFPLAVWKVSAVPDRLNESRELWRPFHQRQMVTFADESHPIRFKPWEMRTTRQWLDLAMGRLKVRSISMYHIVNPQCLVQWMKGLTRGQMLCYFTGRVVSSHHMVIGLIFGAMLEDTQVLTFKHVEKARDYFSLDLILEHGDGPKKNIPLECLHSLHHSMLSSCPDLLWTACDWFFSCGQSALDATAGLCSEAEDQQKLWSNSSIVLTPKAACWCMILWAFQTIRSSICDNRKSTARLRASGFGKMLYIIIYIYISLRNP